MLVSGQVGQGGSHATHNTSVSARHQKTHQQAHAMGHQLGIDSTAEDATCAPYLTLTLLAHEATDAAEPTSPAVGWT